VNRDEGGHFENGHLVFKVSVKVSIDLKHIGKFPHGISRKFGVLCILTLESRRGVGSRMWVE
jgi:hypothetical protein